MSFHVVCASASSSQHSNDILCVLLQLQLPFPDPQRLPHPFNDTLKAHLVATQFFSVTLVSQLTAPAFIIPLPINLLPPLN